MDLPITVDRTLACIALVFACSGALAAGSGATLSCSSTLTERVLLKQAPGKAQRTGKHVLVVTTASGPQRFADVAPFDEPLSGVKWQYCGYDAKAKAHLIGKEDDSLFTGVLLLQETGKTLPGGQTVVFSSDRKAYVATEQPDGQDGEDWTVYDASGAVIWKGYAGLPGKKPHTFLSQFTSPRWNERGELVADNVCPGADDPSGTAILVKTSFGKWRWRAQGTCPAN